MHAATPATACDCIRLDPANPRFAPDIARIADFYRVAAEGIIEADGPYAWRLRTTREFRGTGQPLYRISPISDCSLASDEMNALIGKQIFALLVEGPGDHRGTFELSRCVNFQSPAVEGAIRDRVTKGCPK